MPAAQGDRAPVLRAELVRALERRAEPDGFVPFDRFMDVALYEPGVGYYAHARTPFGPPGDFYTAPRVHPIFARTLARRIAEVHAARAGAGTFTVVDLGSGDGTLLGGVARALGERRGSDGLRYVVVDRTPSRRAASLETVRAVLGDGPERVREAGSLAELGTFPGVVVAHELLDAQPARRLRWDGRSWHELGVRLAGGHLLDSEARGEAAPSGPRFPTLSADDAGTVLEVSPAAEAIAREVADHLGEGLWLVVDFGAEERELLAAHPSGTVASVRAHRALRSPRDAPGESDLSTFVNFTRLRAAASTAGLVEVGYRSQAEALAAWGFAAELDRAVSACRTPEEQVRTRLAAKSLLFGFGTFRVLELAPPASAGRLSALSGPSGPTPS